MGGILPAAVKNHSRNLGYCNHNYSLSVCSDIIRGNNEFISEIEEISGGLARCYPCQMSMKKRIPGNPNIISGISRKYLFSIAEKYLKEYRYFVNIFKIPPAWNENKWYFTDRSL